MLTSAILYRAAGLFVCGLAAHILFWRLLHPKRHLLALLAVFFTPLAFFFIWTGAEGCRISPIEWCETLLLYVSVAFTYIQVYPAAQATSPTLRILLIVGSKEPQGASKQGIQEQLTSRSMVHERIQDLLDAGLAGEDGSTGRLVLTQRGRIMVSPFIILRSILGLPLGKG